MKPASQETERAIDEALDLVELPPIRVGKAVADLLSVTAKAEGVIVQALVRSILEQAMQLDRLDAAAEPDLSIAYYAGYFDGKRAASQK